MTCIGCGNRKTPLNGNSKHIRCSFCLECRTRRKSNPRANLSDAQRTLIQQMAGSYSYRDIAQRLNISISKLQRAARHLGVSLTLLHKYPEDTVKEIAEMYQTHTLNEIQDAYPHLPVRNIINYAKTTRKAVSWSSQSTVAACILLGLGTQPQIARYFRSKGVNIQQIRSFCRRRLGIFPPVVHGLGAAMARDLFIWNVPRIRLPSISGAGTSHSIVLWCEAVTFLRPGLPPDIAAAFEAMAQFQRWLFRGKDPRTCILEIMRRLAAGETDLS